MKSLNYNSFIRSNNLGDCDEETKTVALIKHLSQEINPRILLEDFPQSEFQAKFFGMLFSLFGLGFTSFFTSGFLGFCFFDEVVERRNFIGLNPFFVKKNIQLEQCLRTPDER